MDANYYWSLFFIFNLRCLFMIYNNSRVATKQQKEIKKNNQKWIIIAMVCLRNSYFFCILSVFHIYKQKEIAVFSEEESVKNNL